MFQAISISKNASTHLSIGGRLIPDFDLTSFSHGLIISAKKYLKMPAATEQPAAKKEREELLWQSLKVHVMRERQKIKEGKSTDSIYVV